MNPIRALIATGVASVVLAVCGYLVYDNRDFLFGATYQAEVVAPVSASVPAPVPEVVEVTVAASAAASATVPASAPASAASAAASAKTAATPAPAPLSAASAPAPKAVVAKPSAPVSLPKPAVESAKPEPKLPVAASASAPLTVPLPAPVTASAPAPVPAPKEKVQETKPTPERAKEIQLIIKEIKFTGVTQVPEKELYKAVSEFIGKELTVDQAFAIPGKVTNYYKRNNLMAIATLSGAMTPDGVLTIGVVEMQMTQTQAEKELATLAPQSTPTPVSAPTVLPMRASSPSVAAQAQAQAQAPAPAPTPAPVVQPAPVTATPAVSTVAAVAASSPAKPNVSAATDAPLPATAKTQLQSKAPAPAPALSVPANTPPATPAVSKVEPSPATATPVPMPAAPRPGAVSALTYTPAARTPLPTSKDTDSETDYILKNYAKKTRQYELMVDNYGPDATGSARMGAALSIGNDQLSLVCFKSRGSDYLRMAVNWITGIDGLKVGAHVSTLKYEVVNHLQSAMYQSGDAVKRGVSLIYELVNETSQYSTLALKLDSKSSNAVGLNLANSTAYQSWVSNLEYKGIVREMIPGGAVFTYELSYAQGNVDINGASNIGGIEVDEGPFSKLRFTGTVTQPLDGLGSVFAGLSMQRSRKNLDPSERFYLGGPNGVRAYGVGEGYGSEGELATLEFRQRLTASTTISEFYDWGRARLTHDRAAVNNNTTLSGYGVSIAQEIGKDTTIKGTWARSHGKNTPLPTSPNGNDNVDRNRFWLSMETRF